MKQLQSESEVRREQASHDERWKGESARYPMALVVAPATGRLRILPPRAFRGGREWVEAGQAIGCVESAGVEHLILAPFGGRLGGVMGQEGEPVEAGQAVAWMEPA